MVQWLILSSLVFPLQRDSWEQSVPEPVSQVEALCPDGLASVSIPPSMPSPEPPGSPSQYRSTSRGSSMCSVSGSQPYTLHSLEEAHYHSLTSSSYTSPSSSFACPPYMSSPATDLVSKMVTEEANNVEAQATWAKEDGVSPWSPFEIRRAFWLDDRLLVQNIEEGELHRQLNRQYRDNSGTCFVNRTISLHP